jgi:hypothetical protein
MTGAAAVEAARRRAALRCDMVGGQAVQAQAYQLWRDRSWAGGLANRTAAPAASALDDVEAVVVDRRGQARWCRTMVAERRMAWRCTSEA